MIKDGQHCVSLYNGVHMPILGIGTSHSGGYSHDAMVFALKECGYRLIDTAKRYGCESLIAESVDVSPFIFPSAAKDVPAYSPV